MHFCAFGLLPKFNARCNVNSMFAKSLFSEIRTQKAHFAQLWPVPGSIRRAGRCCGQGASVCILLPKSNGFESRTKVETLPKSKGNPLPKSRMIFSYYVFLLHSFGIIPVFLTISHGDLFQEMVLEVG